jgi:O-antigen/teichoic acid export membrane protein
MQFNIIKSKQKIYGAIEQITNSIGNFSLFIVASNILSENDLVIFALIWAGAQLVLGIAVQWILLPITSFPGETKELFKKTVPKIIMLFLFSFVFVKIYYQILGVVVEESLYVVTCILFLVLTFYELFRYFLIRYQKTKTILMLSLTKWCGLALILYNLQSLDQTVFISAFIVSNIIVLVISAGLVINCLIKVDHNIGGDNVYVNDYPLIAISISNYIFTLATIYSFNIIDAVAFAALQVFRSISNFIPIILQYLETHFSTTLLVNETKDFISNKLLIILSVFSLLFILFFSLCGEDLVQFVYGENLKSYSNFIVVIICITIFQSMNRLLSIQLRLQGKVNIFYVSSILVLIGSILLVIIGGYGGKIVELLYILAGVSLAQLVSSYIWLRYKN